MNQLRIAVLVDGAFFLKQTRKIYSKIEGYDQFNAEYATFILKGIISKHIKKGHYLYRVFYYDCYPYEKKIHNPISGKLLDFAKSDQAKFRKAFFEQLKRQRKYALRLSKLRDSDNWFLDPNKLKDLAKKRISFEQITEADVRLDLRQKGVDMKIGIDIASLAYKKLVDRIVLIAGDADFVPAAKIARREGIDVLLNPLRQKVADDLFEHIDGLNSLCPDIERFYQGMSMRGSDGDA